MLDGLEAIDWQSFNVPQMVDWIMGLTSVRKKERFQSAANLLGYFRQYADTFGIPEEYQEVLSTDAPVLAAPFFIELLEEKHTKEKRNIITILDILASYQNQEGLDAVHQARAEKIYQYLLSKFDIYVPFLRSNDSDIQTAVINLLNRFDEKQHFVIEKLLQLLESRKEQAELVKLSAAEVIQKSTQKAKTLAHTYIERFIRVLRKWVVDVTQPLSIQATAALYLIQLQPDTVEPSIVKFLSNVLKLPGYFHLTLLMLNECVETLMQLGIQRGTDAIMDILDDQTDLETIFDLAVVLLGIHFGADDYRNVHSAVYEINEKPEVVIITDTFISPRSTPLNALQKEILRHLLLKSEIWNVKNNLFALFSLTNQKTALQDLIAEN